MFLGDAPVEEVATVLSGVTPHGSFSLRVTGGGHFGSAAWAGVSGDLDKLARLQQGLKSDLSAAGYLSDARPYRPHLTVSYRGNRAMSAALAGYAGAAWTVTEFALVESKNGDYLPLRAWPA